MGRAGPAPNMGPSCRASSLTNPAHVCGAKGRGVLPPAAPPGCGPGSGTEVESIVWTHNWNFWHLFLFGRCSWAIRRLLCCRVFVRTEGRTFLVAVQQWAEQALLPTAEIWCGRPEVLPSSRAAAETQSSQLSALSPPALKPPQRSSAAVGQRWGLFHSSQVACRLLHEAALFGPWQRKQPSSYLILCALATFWSYPTALLEVHFTSL